MSKYISILDIIYFCKYNKNMNNFLAVNRVAFSIGGFDVYWYGIVICAAIITAIVVATLFCKKKKYDTDMPLTIALVILPTGILAARLFSVIFEPGLSISDFFNFRTGGLSIIGAIIGGGLGLLIYCLIKKRKNAFELFDTLSVVLLLAMAIGRWGNFFNGEVFGQVIEADSVFARFPFAIEKDGIFYQALFFYESCANVVGFIILSNIFMFSKQTGYTTAVMLMYYGILRTILEPLRQSQYILKIAGLPVSRIMSIAMIVIGFAIFVYAVTKSVKAKKVKNEQKA